MNKQKNTRFRVNSQTASFPTLTAMHRRAGLIAALLVALMTSVSQSLADQASPQASTIPAVTSDGAQTLTLKDGRVISFLELSRLRENEQAELLKAAVKRTEKIRYKEWLLAEANTRLAEKDAELAAQQKEEAELDAGLAQMDAFYALLDELFSEQGLQTTPSEQYKSKTIVVTKVLSNSLLTDKFTSDTISLLKGVELGLSQGRNPFATMSAASKAKLKAMLK